jgi:hypothetical protein
MLQRDSIHTAAPVFHRNAGRGSFSANLLRASPTQKLGGRRTPFIQRCPPGH